LIHPEESIMKNTIGFLLLAMGALAATSANATSVQIVNPSFESQVLANGAWTSGAGQMSGWIQSTGGVINPTTDQFSNGVPHGNNSAWLNSGSATQTLSALLTAGSAYTLQVEVGDRKDSNFPGYRVALWAGDNLLASESSLVPNDGFLTSIVHYTALTGNPLLGQALKIELHSNGIQVNFDNVRLDVSPVPEPASQALLLVGLFGIGAVVRRRAACRH